MEVLLNPAAILLTGPKHSGKTSVGRALAAVWDAGFTDLDELVEDQTGESPRSLYKRGPGIFRVAEAEALKSILDEPPKGRKVIAAGGGLVDNSRAVELLYETNIVKILYLEVSPQAAWERISRTAAESGEFPAFLNTADPRGTHFALHTRRAEAYKKIARHVIQTEGKSPVQIAGEILDLFDNPVGCLTSPAK